MTGYIARRMLTMVPVVFIVTVGLFVLVHVIPGDPVMAMLGAEDPRPELVEAIRKQWGLDRPVIVQYFSWLGNAFQGNLGRSLLSGVPVRETLVDRIPVTFQLGLMSTVLAVLIGIPAGIVAALRRGSILDAVVTSSALGWLAMPNFWLAILLILVFAVKLDVLPPSGYVPFWVDPVMNLKLMLMPTVTMATGYAPVIMRQTRSAMLEVLRQDYITTARSKGLAEGTVLWVHALKNASLPVVTILGVHVGHIFGGAVLIESVFAIPGLGRLTVEAILGRDFITLEGAVLLTVGWILAANLLVDLLYAYLDPRIRYVR